MDVEEHIESPVGGNEPPESGQRGYPLIMLFIVVAACAAMLGMFSSVFRALTLHDGDIQKLIPGLLSGGAVGLLVGGVIGVTHFRSLLGSAVGGATGAFTGFVAVFLAAAPDAATAPIMLSAIAGSLTVIGSAAFVRFTRK